MPRYLIIAATLLLATPALTTPVLAAARATSAQILTRAVIAARDAQVAKHAEPEAAQAAVELAVTTVLSQSTQGTGQALADITATRVALGCIAPTAPAASHPASCPQWTNAALFRVAERIRAVSMRAPSATGAANGPSSMPPPPAAGAGGGGGAGYRAS